VIGFHHAVLGADRAPFDKRQQIPLYAFARNIRAAGFLTTGNFVDFIEEYDAVLLGIGERGDFEFVFVDQLRGFLFDQ
jgi:hypothetical protein